MKVCYRLLSLPALAPAVVLGFPVTQQESLGQKPKHPWISLVHIHASRGLYSCFLLLCVSFPRGLHYKRSRKVSTAWQRSIRLRVIDSQTFRVFDVDSSNRILVTVRKQRTLSSGLFCLSSLVQLQKHQKKMFKGRSTTFRCCSSRVSLAMVKLALLVWRRWRYEPSCAQLIRFPSSSLVRDVIRTADLAPSVFECSMP